MTRHVLFADDSSRIRMLLRTVLQGDDHIVLEATNGDEALELLHRKRPDIAILDVSMPALEGLQVTQPTLDGLDVCRAAREDPNLIGLKIIVISAHAESSDALAA